MIYRDPRSFENAVPIGALPGIGALGAGLADDAGEARLRLLGLAELTARDHANWEALSAQAATTSAYARPWFLQASLRHLDQTGDVRLGVVSDEAGMWLGVLPLVGALRYGRVPFPHWRGWRHANQFAGTPLVRRDAPGRFWRGLLHGLDDLGATRLALQLTLLPLDEPVTQALLRVAFDELRPFKIDRSIARARLAGPGTRSGLKGSLRRRIASLGRKLEREVGPLSLRVSTAPDAVAQPLRQLLAFEAAGWKGRAGSAQASADATHRFFLETTAAAAAAGVLEVVELCADERVIAVSSHFRDGDRGEGFKMAYDESLAACGPGLLLLDRMSARFQNEGMDFDSCSAEGQEPVSTLWPERRQLVDCGIALGTGFRRSGLELLDLAETLYRGARKPQPGA